MSSYYEDEMQKMKARADAAKAIALEQKMKMVKYVKLGAAGFAALLMLIFLTNVFVQVEPGHRGVKVTFGKPGTESLPEGLYFVMPITTKIVQLDTRTLKWESKTAAYTRDVQQANISFVLNYGLTPDSAPAIYQSVGTDWSSKLVGQVVVEEIKREIGQHEAVDLIAQRNEAARNMEANIIAKLATRNVRVTGFQLTNIEYTSAFEDAVEAKVVAEQEAIREQNRTVQKIELAKQQVETAKGEAESTLLKAKAEAESIQIRGDALARNPRLVELVTAERWDGKLPSAMYGNVVPFVNVK